MRDTSKTRDWHTFIDENASDYLDNQLPSLERAQFERHVRGCPHCQHTVASYRWTLSLLKQAPTPALPRQFTLPVPKAAPRAPIFGLNMLRLATAIATLVLVSLVGIDLINQLGGASSPQAAAPAARQAQPVPPTIVALIPPAAATPLLPTVAPATPVPTQPVLPALPPAPAQATSVPPMVAPAAIPLTSVPLPTTAAGGVPPAASSGPAATATAPRLFSQPPTSGDNASPTRTTAPVFGLGGGGPDSPTPRARSSADSLEATGPAATAAPKAQSASASPPPSHTPLPTHTATAVATPTTVPTATIPPTVPPPPPSATVLPDGVPGPSGSVPAATATGTLQSQVFARPTSPSVVPTLTSQVPEPAITPLRVGELGAFFAAVFLGTLSLLLWWRRR